MTTKLDEFTIDLKIDTSGFAGNVKYVDYLTKGLTDSLNSLNEAFKKVNGTFKKTTEFSGQVESALAKVGSSIAKSFTGLDDAATKAFVGVDDAMGAMQKSFDSASLGVMGLAEEFAKFKKESGGLGVNLKTVGSATNVIATATTTKLTPAVQQSAHQLSQARLNSRQFAHAMIFLNQSVTKHANGAVRATKSNNDYQKSLLDLSKAAVVGNFGLKAIGSAYNFIQDTATKATDISLLSKNLGENVKVLSAWQQISQQINNGQDGASVLFEQFHKTRADAMMGKINPLANLFNRAQVSMEDPLTHKQRNAETALLELSKKLRGMDRNFAFNLVKSSGLDEYAANLLLASDNLQELVDKQKELTALTQADADAGAEITRQTRERSQLLDKIGRNILFGGDKTQSIGSTVNKWLGEVEHATSKGWKKFFLDYGTDRFDNNSSSSGGSLSIPNTLGKRNNNLGNLRFAHQRDAVQGEGGFARFGSIQSGLNALIHQLELYGDRHIDTIERIISTYAPAADHNNTGAYIANVSRRTHYAANQKLNLHDPAILMALSQAIIAQETNSTVPKSMLQKAAGGNTVNIGTVNVQTTTDQAQGVAHEFGNKLNSWANISQVANGVN